MGVVIRGYNPYCTDSHLDYFTRNLTVCNDGSDVCHVASANGYASAFRIGDGSGSPESPADATEPLDLEDVKAHCRITHDDEDDILQRFMRTARARVERDTGVALVPGSWRITVHQFPSWRRPLHLPIWPVESVQSVGYYDTDGVLQDFGSPTVTLYTDSRPAKLFLPDTETDWPTELREFDPGILDVSAGYASGDLVPDDLKQALYVLIEDVYRHRGSTSEETARVPAEYEYWIRAWQLPIV
jgi:uncharacterized phiE125 gp8 family phage protein